MLPTHAGVLVVGGSLEPVGVDRSDAEGGVGAWVVGGVHLGGVHRGEDRSEVLPLRGDGHASVDERAAADPSPLVDGDAGEVLGVQDAGVLRDVLVDGESEEVAERLFGPRTHPEGPIVGRAHLRVDLAVRAGRDRGPVLTHLDHVDVDAGLRQPQGGDGAAVAGADHQHGHLRAVADRRRRRSRPGRAGSECSSQHPGPGQRTCAEHESSA